MDTKNQLIYFLLSVGIGFAGGFLYELFALLRWLIGCERGKRKGIGAVLDIFFGVAFAFWAVWGCFFFQFPVFRIYMVLGWLLGGIIYAKSLRRMVAFFENVCYNVLVKIVKKAKTRIKLLKKRG